MGIAFRHLMKFCERKDLIDRQSYVAQYVALALFVDGVTTMLGSDDLLAAFACGSAFAWDGFFNRQTEESVFSSVIDLLFNIAAFIFIGAWMPFSDFANGALTLSVWRLIVIAILVLLLRRLPVVIALYKWIPDIKTFREAIFSGHFGPIGVGAVFISTLAAEHLPFPDDPSTNQAEMLAATIQPIVAFMVLCSITIHGLSIPFFSLGRRVHSVSRTWSRHQSMDPMGPEWATHTRRVSRPEDIVINRDSVLERGEVRHIPADEKQGNGSVAPESEFEKKSETASSPSSSMPLKEGTGAHTGDPEAQIEGRPDEPPDGLAREEEWREGPDIIIERQPGPGEEVEVVVKRGAAFAEDGEEDGMVLHTFRGPAHDVDNSVRRFKEKLRDKMHREKKEVEQAAGEISEEIERRVAVRSHSQNGSSDSAGDSERPATGGSTNDDDEEGWTSDRSGQRSRPSSYVGTQSSADDSSRRRSKSPKQHKVGGHSSKRHRTSIRRSLLGKVRPLTTGSVRISEPGSGDEDDDTGEGGRGRTNVPERLGHRRVESLRVPGTPRSASPARSVRSVRFASESGGPSTPAEDRDSPFTPSSRQVAFELPPDPRS